VLTGEHKGKRKTAARENIFVHNLDPDFFEDNIVTCDETWVHYYTPDSKRPSQQWLPAWMPIIRKLQ
jgi:hypothetical protein